MSSKIPYIARWLPVAPSAAATGRRCQTCCAPLTSPLTTIASSASSPRRRSPSASGGGPSRSRRMVAPMAPAIR